MNRSHNNTRTRLASALLIATGTATAALADPAGVEVVAITGTPTANGQMSSFFHRPSINNAGQLTWFSFMSGTMFGTRDDLAHFRGAPGQIIETSRRGNAAPAGNGLVEFPSLPSINDTGMYCGLMYYTGTSGGEADDAGIEFGTGGSRTLVARQGQSLPDNSGIYDQFDAVHADVSGSITFWASIDNALPGERFAIFRYTAGTITTLVRSGMPAPGGPGVLNYIDGWLNMTADGKLVFFSHIEGGVDQYHDSGVFRHQAGVTTKIAREGELSPDANGQLWFNPIQLSIPNISPNGTVAFSADLLGTAGGSSDNEAMFRGTGGALTKIARKGQLAPGGNGTLLDLREPCPLDNGTVIFRAELEGTSGGDTDNDSIMSGNGGALTTIIREGQPTPSGDGQFAIGYFTNWVANAAGEIVIRTDLRNTQAGGDYENAIYFARPGKPLLEIIRNGTPMLGSTVTLLDNADNSDRPSIRPINELGQIAFHFELADGREGVARFTPPPTCLGDFNSDGVRNTLDLTMFLGKFAQNVPLWGIGDMNGDGVVNTLDLTVFLGVFGVPCR